MSNDFKLDLIPEYIVHMGLTSSWMTVLYVLTMIAVGVFFKMLCHALKSAKEDAYRMRYNYEPLSSGDHASIQPLLKPYEVTRQLYHIPI